ncbi:AbrB/MazE/SpoVT family DNA-binding domain-containing protein [Synechococcus phage DSL-LC02]|nr:AbrB/MazE/SpoVT family DNA-binding domain-containing protein [Synechococcus phage DSL-LC02]
MDYTVELFEDDNGDLILPFPEELIEEVGWEDGDVVEFKIDNQGIRIHNITKEE